MTRATSSREVLIAELLGDFAAVLDRIEAVMPRLDAARDKFEDSTARLTGSLELFRKRVVDLAVKAQDGVMTQVVPAAQQAAKDAFDEQTRAMRESARKVFAEEVVPPLTRVSNELDTAATLTRWLCYVVTAVAVATTVILIATPSFVTRRVEPAAAASAPAPVLACPPPASRPEPVRPRK